MKQCKLHHRGAVRSILVLMLSICLISVFMPISASAADEEGSEGFLESVRIGAEPGYAIDPEFTGQPGEYTFNMPENITTLSVAPTRSEAGDGSVITANWTNLNNNKEMSSIITGKFMNLTGFRKANTPSGSSFILDVEKDGVTQSYVFTNKVQSHLKELTLEANGSGLRYSPAFQQDTLEYEASVIAGTEEITVQAVPYGADYTVEIAGTAAENGTAQVALTGDITEIPITVQGQGFEPMTYVLNVKKLPAVKVSFKTDPADAFVYMTDENGDRIMQAADGSFRVKAGKDYSYVVTKTGYVAETGTVNVTEDTEKEIALAQAPESSIDTSVPSVWPNFRGSDNNMAIVDYPTPTSAKATQLNWVNREGGYSWPQIIVDDKVVTATNNVLRMIDRKTGKTVKTANMVAPQQYTNVPMTYSDGIIFCELNGAIIQAFDAKTLESLWVYKDSLGGQPQCVVTVSDGYAYTGFWNSEVKDAHFACFSITDEDPENTIEPKKPTWTTTVKGGFYWANPIIVDDYLLVGSEDGANGNNGTGNVLAIERATGVVVDKMGVTGDIRTSISYDKETDRYYGSTGAGELFSFKFDQESGKLSDKKSAVIDPMLAKCTPVVYKGVIYTGMGNFQSGSMIAVDADTMKEIWRVPLKGKGQTQGSFILSTAYEKESGYIYLYATYNGLPGGVDMVKVKPDETDASNVEVEQIYDADGYSQYCNCSLIADPEGNLYYKNDTGNVFSIGPVMASLESLTAGDGNPEWNKEFISSKENYEITVDPNTPKVTFTFEATEGNTVEINGKAVEGNTCDVKVRDGKGQLVITAKCGEYSKTYTVDITERSQDTSLGALLVNESNTYGSAKTISPAFSPEGKEFVVYGAGAKRDFENVWPEAADPQASVKVFAVSGVDSRYCNEDGEIERTAMNGTHPRYAVYFNGKASGDKTMKVRIEVTSQAGDANRSYLLTITKNTAADVEEAQAFCDSMMPSNYTGDDSTAVAAAKEALQAAIESGDSKEITDALTAAMKVINESKTTEEKMTELTKALEKAEQDLALAKQDVKDAQKAADDAQKSAEDAQKSAEDAMTAAEQAKQEAQQKIDDANQAIEDLRTASEDKEKEQADKIRELEEQLSQAAAAVKEAQKAAEEAQAAAQSAREEAAKAQSSADMLKAKSAKISGLKVKAGKKKVTVSWKRDKTVDGYQVARAAKKNGKYKVIRTSKNNKTVKFVNKKLKKGKKYFYKVRPFTKVDGKLVYGEWSGAKKAKVK